MHMEHACTNIAKSVRAVSRNDERLPTGQDGMFFIDPHLGFA